MTRTEQAPHTSADDEEYMRKVDELVEKNPLLSYAAAMEIVGEPPYELYGENQQEEVVRTQAASALATHMRRDRRRYRSSSPRGEEERVILSPDEVIGPVYYEPYKPLSDEQIAINKEGVERARRALRGE